MTTHTSRSFLHSCLKVPIDPCNNCPAPVYNRPKMYLGRLTTTPLSVAHQSLKTSGHEETLINSDIRSLAKLYDSIPDYCDINHLSEKEFYSTLNTLRSNCCELRTKSVNTCVSDICTTPASSSISSHCSNGKSKRLNKTSKSRPSSVEALISKKKTGKSKRHEICTKSFCSSVSPALNTHKIEFKTKNRIKNYKEEFDDEIKALQNSLKNFEEELKQRHAAATSTTSKLIPTQRDTNENENNIIDRKGGEPAGTKFTTPTLNAAFTQTEANIEKPSSKMENFRKLLKKSFTFNDINGITDSKEDEVIASKDRPETETIIKRAPLKFSSYFAKTNFPSNKNGPPQIVIETPSSEATFTKSSNHSCDKRKKKAKHEKLNEDFKVPFSIFNLGTKAKIEKRTPSPIHPVARPNLAATLRAEVSKKKLKELQNNCTYYDSTPQFDWEVRKTPAWKSLSLNESHKAILSMRLATRKAEQAMQKREYDLNMELMRQRVKSAPLLLEGATFWGSHIGKLTHTCQREEAGHCCQLNQQKTRSKSADSRRLCSYRENATRECSQRSKKLKLLRKIYGGGGGTKVHSRSATQTPTSKKAGDKQNPKVADVANVLNDSVDDLSNYAA